MEEDDFDYKFAYEQHFGAISSESGSENEEEFLRLYGNYEPLPVPIDPNNVIIVPPDELLKQFEHQVDQENALSSSGHIDEEGFITVGVKTIKNGSRNKQTSQFSTNPTKRIETARQSESSSRSTTRIQKNMLLQKKKSERNRQGFSTEKINQKEKLTKTNSTQSNKQNHKPTIPTFKINENEFPVLSTSPNIISRTKGKKHSTSTFVPSLMEIEFDTSIITNVGRETSTGAKKKKSKNKQNNVPNTPTFKFTEDEFPALSSSTSNITRSKEKMLSNQCRIEPKIIIPRVQEVSNTNQKDSAVEAFVEMERSSYHPIISTTTNHSLMEMEVITNNNAVKPQNEVSYSINCTPECIRTDSDLFTQNEMKFKNEDTKKVLDGLLFDSFKSFVTHVITEKSTGAKRKKPKNKQNYVPNTPPFQFKVDDSPNLSSYTSNVSRPEKEMLSNQCQIGAEINVPKDQEVSNMDQEYGTVYCGMEKISYVPIINTTTIPSLMEREFNTSYNTVKHQNEVSYSMNYTPGNSTTDSGPFIQNEIKLKNEDTTKDLDGLFFDSFKSLITHGGREISTGAKKKKSKNKLTNAPNTPTFEFKEDEFPVLSSSTSNITRSNGTMLSNQCQIELDVNTPKDQEVSNTNQEYGTVGNFLKIEKISYPPTINTTTIPSLMEIEFDTSYNYVKPQNEVSYYMNYEPENRTDCDFSVQDEMKFKNENTKKNLDGLFFKSFITYGDKEKSTGAKKKKSKNKQNIVPNTTSFKFKEDEFPALSSSTSNITRSKEKMLSNQCQTGAEIYIPKDQEVSNTNQEYGTAGKFLEMDIMSVDSLLFDSYKSSITNIGTEKSCGAKKKKSKNKKQKIVETVEEHKIETLESISQKKQNHVPNTPAFKFKEVDFPNISSSTSNVSKPEEEMLSNQCQIGAEINIPKDQGVSNTNQNYSAVEAFLEMERSSYYPIISTTTNHSLMEMEVNTNNNDVKPQNEVSYSINCTPECIRTDTDLFMHNEMKFKNENPKKDLDELFSDKNISSITNIGTEKSTGAKKKKSKNKKQKNVNSSITVEEHKIETLEGTSQLIEIKNKVFIGNSLMHKMFQVSENVMIGRQWDLINNRVLNYFDFVTLLNTWSNAELSSNFIRVRDAKESFKIMSQFIEMENVVIPSPVTVDDHCVELTKGSKLKVNFSGNATSLNSPEVPNNIMKEEKTELQLVNNMMEDASLDYMYCYGYNSILKAEECAASYISVECKTLENISQFNDLQNVIIADSAPITDDDEISRSIELTEENKLETNSNGNDICFNDPQVYKNIPKSTKTEIQLVNNMMQDASFNNVYYYSYYGNLKAEECVASYTAIECKTSENILQLNEMQNVAMADNLQIENPNFNVSQNYECVQKLHKRKMNFINNPELDASNYGNYTHIAKNNVPYKRDCDTNMSIKELTSKVNSAAIVNIQEVSINTDDQLTSTNVKMSRKTCDVGVNTSKLVTTKNACVNTSQPNSNISISDIFDKFIKLTRCDNKMPPSIQLALQLTIILLMIQLFLSLILWALDNSILICLIILFGFYFND